MPEQDVAPRQQDVSSVLVAFGYVAAVALVLPVLLVGRVYTELLMLEFGVTFVAFAIAGRRLQEHGSVPLARLGGFLWLLTPPLVAVWMAGYVALITPPTWDAHTNALLLWALLPLVVWALLAAYFYDRRPSAIQHLCCFSCLLVMIAIVAPPGSRVTAWFGPNLVALGATWLIHTLRLRLQPGWLGYALGWCTLSLGLLMLLMEMLVSWRANE